MFDTSDEKLHRAKDQLIELIAELDVLLMDVRESRAGQTMQNGSGDEPEWIQQIARQRDILVAVAAQIADMSLDTTPHPMVSSRMNGN
jgi:hypothetical protein